MSRISCSVEFSKVPLHKKKKSKSKVGNNGNFSWIEIELRFWKKMILAMREKCHQTVITVDYTK